MPKRAAIRYYVRGYIKDHDLTTGASIIFDDVDALTTLCGHLKSMGVTPNITAEVDEVDVPEETPTDIANFRL